MKNLIVLFFLLVATLSVTFAAKITDDVLNVGKAGNDFSITHKDGGYLKKESGSGNWLFSADGILEKKMGSGSGSGSGGGVNVLLNSSFEDGLVNWTNSGGTFTQETYTNSVEGNAKYSRFVATAAGQYIETDLTTFADSISGGAMADFKYLQGDDAFDFLVIDNGSTVISSQAISDISLWMKVPTATMDVPTSAKIRIISTAAGTIDIDEAYLGSNKNFSPAGKQSHFIGSAQWPNNINNFWTTAVSNAWSDFPSDTDALTPLIEGSINVSDKNVPVVTILNAKKGRYVAVATGGRFTYQGANDNGGYRFHDGVSSWGGGRMSLLDDALASIRGEHTVTTEGDITLSFQGYASGTGNTVINNEIINEFKISIFYYPTDNETAEAFTPEQADFFIDVNIGGGNPGYSNNSVPQPLINGTLDMVLNRGSAKMACQSALSTGLTCSGNEIAGLDFAIHEAGDFKVCASFYSQGNGAFVTRLVETELDSQTILQQGNSISGSNVSGATSHRLCEIFSFDSIGEKRVNVFYEANNTGSVLISRTSTEYQRDMNITVEMVSHNVSRPIIQNMVDTANANGLRTESCRANNNSVATIDGASGLCESWIDSVSRTSNGVIQYNFKAGVFSGTPICNCSMVDNNHCCNVNTGSTSSINVNTTVCAAGLSDLDVNLSCKGKR